MFAIWRFRISKNIVKIEISGILDPFGVAIDEMVKDLPESEAVKTRAEWLKFALKLTQLNSTDEIIRKMSDFAKSKLTEQVQKKVLDLIDYASVHYYITKGRLSFYINNKKINVNEGDALWVAPYTKHGFSGKGSLIKLSNGEAMDNLNMFEISKIFKPQYTLKRIYKDLKTWGYDR